MHAPRDRTAEISAAADAVVQRAVRTEPGVPGVVAGVTDGDGEVYLGAAGARSLDSGVAMTPDTVLAIFSTTKAVTATAVLQLVEEGRLDLDAPAAEHAPELADIPVLEGFDTDGNPVTRPPRTPVTTRHLLTHTAGFGYAFFAESYRRLGAEHGQPPIVEATRAALRTPLLFDPGTSWEYGSSIDWAGLVVEGVTGQRLGAVVEERICRPLGMRDTSFTPTPAQLPRLAALHQRGRDGTLRAINARPRVPEIDMGGHGLYSTVPDYLRFIRMWLNDGRAESGHAVLQPETVAMAVGNHLGDLRVKPLTGVLPALANDVDLFPGLAKSWALSFLVNDEDAPTGRPAGSLGWMGLANLYYWIDRRTGLGGFWGSQLFPFGDRAALDASLAMETAVYDALR